MLPFNTAAGGFDRRKPHPTRHVMKIKSIETFSKGTSLSLVRVTTTDGEVGYGQVAPFNADITAQVLHRQIAPHAMRYDADDIETLSDICVEANLKFPWSYVCRALSGVDTAIWDIKGKRADKPVWQLLGGRDKPIRAYGSSMSRSITPEDEAERLKQLRDEKGFTAFKIRAGKACGHDVDAWPGRTEKLVPAVRAAIGDDVALLVDGNSCYTPDKAIEVGRMLEDNGVVHFEEPCPYWQLEWTAQVASALQLDVAGGEQDNDLAQWRRMVAMDAVDIVQPDICYVGGLTRAMRVAAIGGEGGKPCVPHSANLSMVTLFTLHMLTVIDNAGPYMEYSIEDRTWTDGMFDPPLEVTDGHVPLPRNPGWGVTVNDAWLASADRQVSEAD
jgi:L-alanine-DL-glutamate epimerase-like enolase superfamily enzyme